VVAAIGDPDGERTISSIVALLIALGVALLMVAVWLFRMTRPDPELLAPLELMGEQKWRRADPVWQRRRLDDVRPPDAEPMQATIAPPDLDEAFERGPSVSGFEDLYGLRLDPPGVRGARRRSGGSHTPPDPWSATEGLLAGEVDPELLAAAEAELDAEFEADAHGDASLGVRDGGGDRDEQ
jgi:hypothetical protein